MKFPDPEKPLAEQDEDVLHAMMVWGEARGESPRARAAVAHVPVTRARVKKSSLRRELLRKYAFSCFLEGDPNLPKLFRPVEHEGLGLWAVCWRTAAEARLGQSANPAPDSTHYLVRKMWRSPPARRPQWYDANEVDSGRTTYVTTLGGHVFARTSF